MKEISELLKIMESERATELHLVVGVPPMIRVGHDLIALDERAPAQLDTINLLQMIASPKQIDHYQNTGSVSFSYSIPAQGRYFCYAFSQRNSTSLIFELMQNGTYASDTPQDVPSQLSAIARLNQGLILVAGAKRSGKTLAATALLKEINETKCRHIMTLENPIHVLLRNKKSMITQRELGTDFFDIRKTLDDMLRNPPDVLYVDGIYDYSIIEKLSLIADSGSLVILTSNLGDMEHSLEHIILSFAEEKKAQVMNSLSKVLKYVIFKKAIPSTAGETIYLYDIAYLDRECRKRLNTDNIYKIREMAMKKCPEECLSLNKELDSLFDRKIINSDVYEESRI